MVCLKDGREARRLAELGIRFQGATRIDLVHVMEPWMARSAGVPSRLPSTTPALPQQDPVRRLEHDFERELFAEPARLLSGLAPEIRTIVLRGAAERELERWARDGGYDLIVIGGRRSGHGPGRGPHPGRRGKHLVDHIATSVLLLMD